MTLVETISHRSDTILSRCHTPIITQMDRCDIPDFVLCSQGIRKGNALATQSYGQSRSKAGLPGAEHGLGAVNDLQFAEDIGDVVADGFWAEDELLGDIGVAVSLGDES